VTRLIGCFVTFSVRNSIPSTGDGQTWDRAVEWDPCNRSSGLVARRSGSIELELAPWATRLTQPLLATAPVRAKNQHTAAFLPGQFRCP
jgi:hypothetical protein